MMNPGTIITAVLMALAAACLLVMGYLYSTLPANAHSFYSQQCCRGTDHGGDCEPLPRDAVTETPDGWWVKFKSPTQGYVNEGVKRGDSKVHDSEDGFDHVCLQSNYQPPNPEAITQRIRCFYRRIGDS